MLLWKWFLTNFFVFCFFFYCCPFPHLIYRPASMFCMTDSSCWWFSPGQLHSTITTVEFVLHTSSLDWHCSTEILRVKFFLCAILILICAILILIDCVYVCAYVCVCVCVCVCVLVDWLCVCVFTQNYVWNLLDNHFLRCILILLNSIWCENLMYMYIFLIYFLWMLLLFAFAVLVHFQCAFQSFVLHHVKPFVTDWWCVPCVSDTIDPHTVTSMASNYPCLLSPACQ